MSEDRKITWEKLKKVDYEALLHEFNIKSIETQAELRGAVKTLTSGAPEKSRIVKDAETAILDIKGDFQTLEMIMKFTGALREGIMMLEDKLDSIETRLKQLEGDAEYREKNR